MMLLKYCTAYSYNKYVRRYIDKCPIFILFYKLIDPFSPSHLNQNLKISKSYSHLKFKHWRRWNPLIFLLIHTFSLVSFDYLNLNQLLNTFSKIGNLKCNLEFSMKTCNVFNLFAIYLQFAYDMRCKKWPQ
jgi:hypothetical protein